MCGIVGLSLQHGDMDVDVIDKMRDALAHRGPDDAGTWISESSRVALAHRRLSIIDLTHAGSQPMASEDGALIVVFNGEIYNFQELRLSLQQKGYRFKSNSDTEVILHAYKEWGTGALEKFNGMFAFALFDKKRDQIFIARDRFGEKPIYYFSKNGDFIFASELKALEIHPAFCRDISYEQLTPFFLFGYTPYPNSIYENTYKLPPGHFLIFDLESRKCEIKSYWQGLEDALDYKPTVRSEEALLSELDQHLRASIKMRLVADVPVGAFLSGGVDSSLVVSLAMQMKSDLKTFSIGVEDRERDEAPYARRIAEYLGCDHNEQYISSDLAKETLLKLPAMYDEPFADSSAIPTHLVSVFARDQVTVALSGDGGDELFGGYTTYPMLARSSALLKVPRVLRYIARLSLQSVGSGRFRKHASLLDTRHLWQFFLYLNERTVAKYPDVEKLLTSFNRESITLSGFTAAFDGHENASPIEKAMYADSKTYLVDDILTKVDRASMATSLETRIPFLDHHLAEFAAGIPVRSKMGYQCRGSKVILRNLLSRYVPAELFERPKRGFNIPLGDWLRGDLRWLVREYLDSVKLKKEGLFNVPFVERVVDEHMTNRRDREVILWALIFWEMWRESKNIG